MVALELEVMCDNNDSGTAMIFIKTWALCVLFFLSFGHYLSFDQEEILTILMYTFDIFKFARRKKAIVHIVSFCVCVSYEFRFSDGSTIFLFFEFANKCIVEMNELWTGICSSLFTIVKKIVHLLEQRPTEHKVW